MFWFNMFFGIVHPIMAYLMVRYPCQYVLKPHAQSLSRVWLFATPWTAAHQDPLSCTVSQSLLKLLSIESVMPSNCLILCRPLLLLPSIFPASGSFPMKTWGLPTVIWGFPGGSVVKNLSAIKTMQDMQVQSLGQEDPLEEEMATHSSIFAWAIP